MDQYDEQIAAIRAADNPGRMAESQWYHGGGHGIFAHLNRGQFKSATQMCPTLIKAWVEEGGKESAIQGYPQEFLARLLADERIPVFISDIDPSPESGQLEAFASYQREIDNAEVV